MQARRKPPRKRKGSHNPVDDRLLVQLYKALRIKNPHLTKRAFAAIAQKNYYPASIAQNSIIRHLNRLLEKRDK
jgi:hypothetical protein